MRRSRSSDADLVGALSSRHARVAAECLFERYWDDCWRIALAITGSREIAEDVAQESLLRLFRHPEAWDSSRPLGPWIRKVGANLAIDAVRARRWRYAQSFNEEDDSVHASQDDGWLSDVDTEIVAELRKLTNEQRVVLFLRYWADCSVAEIADVLAIPEGTVMSRVGRGLAQLRKELEENHA